ncbi:putative lipoprotein [Burkholderia mallei]|nr:putative lipoprotein [Burkholderia mallei]KOT11475.1 putative lipoprotein [Burkholderia mallei]KOT19347.1 putative lipoprotein [Burkholderia mallei]
MSCVGASRAAGAGVCAAGTGCQPPPSALYSETRSVVSCRLPCTYCWRACDSSRSASSTSMNDTSPWR